MCSRLNPHHVGVFSDLPAVEGGGDVTAILLFAKLHDHFSIRKWHLKALNMNSEYFAFLEVTDDIQGQVKGQIF